MFKQINDVIVALTRKFTSNSLSTVRFNIYEQVSSLIFIATFKKYSKMSENGNRIP